MNKKHLSLKDRYVIEERLNENQSFKIIGKEVGKSPSSISREIKKNYTVLKPSGFNNSGNSCKLKKDCTYTNLCSIECSQQCKFCAKCNNVCPDYSKDSCERLDHPPYVCNGCQSRNGCRKEKFVYKAKEAHENYIFVLKSSREGINLTDKDFETLSRIVPKAIKQGHSPAMIVMNNPELKRSETTIYRDIERGLFDTINNTDLPRKVKFKKRISKIKDDKTPKETKNRENRTFDDMLIYKQHHPCAKVVQFDTVEGKKGGKSLFTIHFPTLSYMIAFLITAQKADIIVSKLNIIKKAWGNKFYIDFEIGLTDNGKEFQLPDEMEYYDEEHRMHLFYCDPGKSYQKAEIENNHTFIRRILPKGSSFDDLTQDDIDLMMNHINSTPREELNGNTPYELACLLIGEDIIHQFSKQIEKNDVILKPELLNKNKRK